MKLALLYTVWTGDDMEMLQWSIEQHALHVDQVFICYQTTSNVGEVDDLAAQLRAVNFLMEFAIKGVKLILKDPDLSLSTKENERIKHNLMIQEAKKHGFTHFIMAACDHFYDAKTFDYCKNWVKENGPDVILTKMITYYKSPEWALWPLESYYMPFIHKMHPNTEISATAKYPVLVDPSVKVNTFNNIIIPSEKEAILHHHSMIRPDIRKKFRNAASSIRWKPEQVETFISEYENAKLGDNITYFQGRELVDVKEVLKRIG